MKTGIGTSRQQILAAMAAAGYTMTPTGSATDVPPDGAQPSTRAIEFTGNPDNPLCVTAIVVFEECPDRQGGDFLGFFASLLGDDLGGWIVEHLASLPGGKPEEAAWTITSSGRRAVVIVHLGETQYVSISISVDWFETSRYYATRKE